MASQPIKNLNEIVDKQSDALRSKQMASAGQGRSFNPFIYGNDIDCVDIATRVAMVSVQRYAGAS